MSDLYGDEPRPWIIADGVPSDSALASELRRISSKVTFLDKPADLGNLVRQSDYDAYVVLGGRPSVAHHLYVLQFGGGGSGDSFPTSRDDLVGKYKVWQGYSRARRLVGPSDAAPPEAADLARRSLVQHLLPMVPRNVVAYSVSEGSGMSGTGNGITHFVAELDGLPCAGLWRRPNDVAEWWWLPEDTPEPEKWVAAAFAAWSRLDTARFPPRSSWRESPEWMTQREQDAQDQVNQQRVRIERVRVEMEAELVRLEAVREDARVGADGAERRLLTAQGDDLVAEVAAALRELGFGVVESDTLPARANEKLEDLRVTEKGWIGLAEVKGFGARRGASTAGLQQLGRAVERYVLAESRTPDARWYIVNQFAGTDPASRPRPLAGSEDVEVFAHAHGLVLDTTDLFRLREGVRARDLTAQKARGLLKDAVGVFAFAGSRAHVEASS